MYIYDNAYHKFKPVADYERGYIKLTRLVFMHTYILYKVVSYGIDFIKAPSALI